MKIMTRLYNKKLIHPPKFLITNTHYLVRMGSDAYGCSSGSSDIDLYGWCIPPKEMIFPHLGGEIIGFGKQSKRFEVWQEHHIKDNDKEYDFSVYSVIKFFQLCMENNPNMVDALFVPTRCVFHCTQVGNIMRDNRKLFLHKGCWHKFKGYAYSQLHKMKIKNPEKGKKRAELIKKYGHDVKFGYHCVRLILEVEQILAEHDLDLERNREQLKAIRRGEWDEGDIREFFTKKEKSLEELYHKSNLRYIPDEDKIKELLLQVLEQHYGSLDKMVYVPDKNRNALLEIKQILDKVII